MFQVGSILIPLSSHVRTAGCSALCKLAGHLKLCSASLYFVPRNVEEPILRIPFRATTSIVRYHTDTPLPVSSLPRGASVGVQRCFVAVCSICLCLAPATGSLVGKGAGRRRLEARLQPADPGARRQQCQRWARRKACAALTALDVLACNWGRTPCVHVLSERRCEPDRGGGGGGDAGMAGEELFSVQCTERVEMMAGDRCTPYTWRRVRQRSGAQRLGRLPPRILSFRVVLHTSMTCPLQAGGGRASDCAAVHGLGRAAVQGPG